VSLGGSLLGHGPGTTPSFEIDLELGRSLSSGLLDSAAAKPSQRDGGPVESPAGDSAAGSEAGGREVGSETPALEEEVQDQVEEEVTQSSVPASMTPEPEPLLTLAPPATSEKSVAPAPIVLSAKNESAETSQSASFVLLSIDVEPGSRVEVDGQSIGAAPFSAIFIEMGTHTFVAETPDGIRIQQMIDVQIGTDVIEF
jgi:hypothetical protein